MTGLTKIPVKMLSAQGKAGSDMRYDGREVVLVPEENTSDYGIVGGSFDSTSGTATLALRNGSKIQITGFMTVGNIGVGPIGPTGPSGRDGRDGLNGTDGEKGATGCQGPAGPPGRQGPRGDQGLPGPTGAKGADGATGPKGDDGTVQIWIQSDDPAMQSAAHLVPGALWIKP